LEEVMSTPRRTRTYYAVIVPRWLYEFAFRHGFTVLATTEEEEARG
jgi:hypothetical protein